MRFSSKASKIISLVSIVVILGVLLMAGFVLTRSGKAAHASSLSSVPVIDDATLKAMTSTMGGASPLPTTRTIPHWFGQTLDPHNGVTYGYNMVGADPNNCSGANCSVTIQADITPVIVNIGGLTFSGSDVLGATLASPQFALNDYGSTPAATAAGAFPNAPALVEGPGGALSQGDAGNALQLQDATMRAQFNQTGSSNYHLILHPNVLPTVTINVPSNQGVLLQSGRGVIFADISISWWSAQIQNLESTADPTHLPIYLTNNVLLHVGSNIFNCCVIGFHGTRAAGLGGGSNNSNGNAVVQTFAWASWVQPGIYSRPNGGTDWALQDIHALSHEIAEWGDDPFVNNTVEPWLTPTAPQYGCTGVLETGDPVVAIGFAMGTNTFQQGPNPNGTQSADGYYHPEDETFLPWFMRTAPNNVSEPTQISSANGGRYTLMGSLNPFQGFRQPATGC
ncbi:MAG TPA: hypothetical protein VEU97_16650 [Ktedonobacteraceae bacterium]|nr:hypothetical protein [Ktedonobacteraceae bacterium]